LKLTVAYHGAQLAGWQRQPTAVTVQGCLEAAIAEVVGAPVSVVGASRTDAGVHARGQCAHVDVPVPIPPEGLHRAINHRLPSTVRVVRCVAVPRTFHARFAATGKRYIYRATWQPSQLPWADPLTATIAPPQRPDALVEAATAFLGRHDFAAFTVPEAARGSTVRTVRRATVRAGPRQLVVDVVGSGFLRYQVRRMVGALLEVGSGQRTVAGLAQLLVDPEPGAPIVTAPAGGLCLEHVYYGGRGALVASDLSSTS
jgi:tRNA pseudouridine38-40 synthase